MKEFIQTILIKYKVLIFGAVGIAIVVCIVMSIASCDNASYADKYAGVFGDNEPFESEKIQMPSQCVSAVLNPAEFTALCDNLTDLAVAHDMICMFGSDVTADDVRYLVRKTSSDEALMSLVQDIGSITQLSEESRLKLAKLAVTDVAAVGFAEGAADAYPASNGEPYTASLSAGEVPLLFQWDSRWGYTEYSGTMFGLSGCCPTCLSMVYMGLTSDTSMSPYDMACIAYENDYVTPKDGTLTIFLSEVAPQLGLYCEEFPSDESALVSFLEIGKPVIINVGPGDFTDGGHFIVAYGITDDGRVRINDPYSSLRSSQTWEASVLAQQSIGMFAFSCA